MRALSAVGLLFAACQLWPRVAHAEHKGQIIIDLRHRWDDGDPTLLLEHLNLMTRNGTLTDEWEAIRQELASLSPVKLSKAFREQHPLDALESPWRDAMARIDFEFGSRCGTQDIPAPLELLVDEAVRASIEAGTFQFGVDDTDTGTDAKREEDTGFNRTSTLTHIRDMIRAGTPHKRREGHTPLQEAAIWGLVEEAESLLKLGADIEARSRPGDPRFTHTETPLHCAAYQDHTSAVGRHTRRPALPAHARTVRRPGHGPGRPHVRAPRHRRVAQQKEDVAPDARAPRRDGSRPAARRPQAHRVVSGEEAPAVD